uniref:WGS project CBMG000000000 data, contig CS5907-c000342 n=1 Tax=Fusarium acuminatum CS5907 TaxID=1318461 RepID=A0A096PF24_9HYPO|nr:unnamed protein product [Fusarium acuminatum CS5907]
MRTSWLYPIFIATHVSAGVIKSTTRPLILADINRNGIINGKDITDKYTWINKRGAIFLPNIGDKYHRCTAFDVNGLSLTSARTASLESISKEAVGSIYTLPESTLGSVHIFWKQPGFLLDTGSPWRIINPQFIFNASSLRTGIKLAIDARDLVSHLSAWNGTLSLEFRITDGNITTYNAVAMKQAPVLFYHHLQRVERVLSAGKNETSSPVQNKFIHGLEEALTNVAETPVLHLLNGTDEIWAQDFMEPGFASMPGREGPISLRILVRSAQSTRVARRQSPLILKAGWLVIGHVDEFVQFLPYQNDLGWTITIADTQAPLALLRKA